MDSIAAALHTIHSETLTSHVLAWSSLIVPSLGALILWAVRARLPAPRRDRIALGTLGLCGAYCAVALFFVACAIGDTGKRQLGRAVAAPVLAALDRYHAAVGTYPDSLPQLIPTFLPATAINPPEQRLLNGPLRYARDQDGFLLSFAYLGPGANTCTTGPQRVWSCVGFY